MSKIDPVFMSKLKDLAEKGISPDEILETFRQEDIVKENLSKDDEITFDTPIPDEIRTIAQALAYRDPDPSDFDLLYALINKAYSLECFGSQAFRVEGPCIEKSTLQNMLLSSEYRWIIVEAPSGSRGDGFGTVLGAACFTTTGKSTRNGSVRLFCVAPDYQRLNVGKRLLHRVEKHLIAENCVRIMFSVPSTRSSLEKWLHNRGFEQVASILYPSTQLNHTLTADNITLNLFQKPLDFSQEKVQSAHSPSSELQRNTHLPPHWRGIRNNEEKEDHSKESSSIEVPNANNNMVDIPDVD